jgi:general secretion pathway protein H
MRRQASREAGFTLIEMVAVLAIVSALAALALPNWPHGTTRPQLEAYALNVAALLKADRDAALRTRKRVETLLDRANRKVVSGAGAGEARLPEDVAFDAIVAETCSGRANGAAIDFLPSGMSCGGSIALARPGAAYHVRVNWLTGGVEVVAAEPPR